MIDLIGGALDTFFKKHPDIKAAKDEAPGIADKIAGGLEGLDSKDVHAAIQILNASAFKGKLKPAQEVMLSEGIVLLGKLAARLLKKKGKVG